MIYQCADRVAEWLRRWNANPIWSPCVGSKPISVDSFLKYVELNSLSVKTDVYLILLLIHKKICVQKFLEKQSAHKLLKFVWTVSQATKPWKTLNLFYEENRMANVYIFLLKPFQQWNFEKLQVFLLAKFFKKKL